MRTVTVEILREGPPNNQLLSPLTTYLGLCGDHTAESITIPYVHSKFLSRLRSLRYKDSSATREARLEETAGELMEVLSQLPGLVHELTDAQSEGSDATHLRLVLSAHELALLPFELALSPKGCPGGGSATDIADGDADYNHAGSSTGASAQDWLGEQSADPVCLCVAWDV